MDPEPRASARSRQPNGIHGSSARSLRQASASILVQAARKAASQTPIHAGSPMREARSATGSSMPSRIWSFSDFGV